MQAQKQFNHFHSIPIQIRFNDIDQLGHATNSVYQQYFDLGRIAYFNEVLMEQMNWEIEGLILVSISIDYLYPIKLYDKVIVRSKIYHIGNKSLRMSQEIFNESTNAIAATSIATMVAYSNKSQTTMKVPKRWCKKIVAYEQDILFEV